MPINDTVQIEGNVTRDPVLKKTKTGKSVCTFSVAVNHFSKGDAEQKVSFFDVETWEKLAESCVSNITKGRRVMVFGSLRQERWDDADGKKHSRLKIVGRDIRYIESLKKPEAA